MVVDPSGGVFVDDSGFDFLNGSIVVYAPSASTPLRTITTGVQSPNFIATIPSNGAVTF